MDLCGNGIKTHSKTRCSAISWTRKFAMPVKISGPDGWS